MSPSDLRRPREESHIKVVGQAPNKEEVARAESVLSPDPAAGTNIHFSDSKVGGVDQVNSEILEKKNRIDLIKKEAAAREASFIDEFFAEQQPSNTALKNDTSVETSWRQTALQRRKSMPLQSHSQRVPSVVVKELMADVPSLARTVAIPTSQATEAILGDQTSEVQNKGLRLSRQVEPAKAHEHDVRSASQILAGLPKEDIDFLSAADIRAKMGSRRSKLPSDDIRVAERARLEDMFAKKSEIGEDMDSMVQAQILNNQHIRRKTRELHEAQQATEPTSLPARETAAGDGPGEEQPVESSIERMKKWLETTGASFAKQFWQDPTEAADITQSKLFFDRVYHYIRKGRTAMRPIVNDLESDVPASKNLLGRLKRDEDRLELAVHRLRQRSSAGTAQGLTPRKIKAMESIKANFHQTNVELEKAYATLRELADTEAVLNAPDSLRRRLTMASKVLHKNTQLSRMLIYSIQTRLEDPKIDRSVLPNYKMVADDLLSLRDTQMALMRLVDHAVLVYGVSPQKSAGGKGNDPGTSSVAEFEGCEEPYVRARLAADAHLINEIKAHKSAMQGLSDDGYTRQQKSTPSVVLDEPKPLTHSLFRPFTPVFDSLGSKNESEAAAQIEADKKARDAQLVADVKKAYEDTYGAITVDHQQVVPETEAPEASNVAATKSFEMLKDEPDASLITTAQATPETTFPQPTPATVGENDVRAVPDGVDAETSVPVAQPQSSVSTAENAASDTQEVQNAVAEMPSISTPTTTSSNLPTNYTILIYDQQTNNLSITTSTSGAPRDTTPVIPLHQALAIVDFPSKFVVSMGKDLEVVSAKKDMLVLRDVLKPSSTATSQTASAPTNNKIDEPDSTKSSVNPIDGTTRLSPTGYVGPEESAEQLEKEFKERRDAAGRFHGKQAKSTTRQTGRPREEPKKRGAAGIVKTAIWATALCYIVGVFGEIATNPFKV